MHVVPVQCYIFFPNLQEEVPPLTSDSEPDEYIHNDKLRSQSVSRVSASRTSLDNNKVSSYFITSMHVVVT
jgi:hypothetical protein